MKFLKIFVVLVFYIICSCTSETCSLPEEFKTPSNNIAFFAERQGMTTYDVDLRKDKRYICKYSGFGVSTDTYTFGIYESHSDTLFLDEFCDFDNLLCFSYFIETTNVSGRYSWAIPQCDNSCAGVNHEEMWFEWY
ncbi:MAG: hypothetical protein GQ574_02480 [Crocinitomix sp.]|nr:hypothetical protein [Crocinitomix sp.]